MKRFVPFFLILLSFEMQSQWNWAKNISIQHWEYGKFLSRSSKSMYIAGETGYYGINPSDVFIAKYDPKGNLESVIQDTASKIIDFASDDEANCYAILVKGNTTELKKFDTTWHFAWRKIIPLTSIAVHKNHVYTAGKTDTIIKYDSKGNYVSSCIAPNISIHKIRTDYSGNLYLIGETGNVAVIAKFDSTGNLAWNYSCSNIGNNYYSSANDLDFDINHNVYITGNYMSRLITQCDTLETKNDSHGLFTLKLNSMGQCQWIRNRGSRNLSVTNEGVYVCASDTIYKYSLNGNFAFAMQYPLSPYATSKKTSDAIYFTGIFSGNINLGNQSLSSSIATDAYLGKYSPIESNSVNRSLNTRFSAFPNPSNGIFQMLFNNEPVEQDICIYDILGNCILTKSLAKGGKLDLSSQPKGVYFAEITEKEKKHVAKLVVQ